MKPPLIKLAILLLCLLNYSVLEAQETPDFATEITYEVAFVPPMLSANVYAEANDRNPIGSLLNGTILDFNGEIEGGWFGIQYEGESAWIHQDYVIGNISPVLFCFDARVMVLIESLKAALRIHDSVALANIAVPQGLFISLAQGGTIRLDQEEVQRFFDDHQQRNWGLDLSGEPVIKTIVDDVVPLMEHGLLSENVTIACQHTLDNSPEPSILFVVELPYTYDLLNFYSVMPSSDNSLKREAWGIGITYWQDEPKIIALGHYTWTP